MIEKNFSLKHFNTFGIDAKAKLYSVVRSEEDLYNVLKKADKERLFILGGGSNILFTKNFDGLVLKNDIIGFKTVEETSDYVIIEAGAGLNWHEFVLNCIDKDYGGIENLSLIPGNVGASPMQNIGAYGTEIKDVFEYLDAYNIESGEMHRFNSSDCKFGYRESVFKNIFKDQYVICRVALKLSKNHTLNTSYGAIENELKEQNISNPTIRDVSNAVIAIRQSKLPDPKIIGNAGSFFKNPLVSEEELKSLIKENTDIPHYPGPNNKVKLAAGWLIEKCGWKGKTIDDRYGVHHSQALVLVNLKNSKGKEILELSEHIMRDVKEKFNISLEREVNIL
jgi:UDP-N-acetylmuramate dehydrogenase